MKVPSLIILSFCLVACAPAVSTGANASSQTASSEGTSVSAEASLAPAATLLPQGFTGRWDASLDACKVTSDMKLIITQTELTFWESSGEITAVTIKGPADVTVKAAFQGENDPWTRELHLVLSSDGQTLMVDETKRVRCP